VREDQGSLLICWQAKREKLETLDLTSGVVCVSAQMIHAVLVSQQTIKNDSIDLIVHHLDESAHSFSEHYYTLVFVPLLRYAVSHFIRVRFNAVTNDKLPTSVRVRPHTLYVPFRVALRDSGDLRHTERGHLAGG
jgi:hypothetical protein